MSALDDPKRQGLQKRMLRLALYETPGTILVVLGLYAKFWVDGTSGFDFLNDDKIVNGILALGIVIWLAPWTEFIKFLRQKLA